MGFTVENLHEKARYSDDEWKEERKKKKTWKIPVAVNNSNFIEHIIYVLLGVMLFSLFFFQFISIMGTGIELFISNKSFNWNEVFMVCLKNFYIGFEK